MTRISLSCLAMVIVFSQIAYAQSSIRLGAGGSKVVSDAALATSKFSLGYTAMAGLESPLGPVASILAEGGYVYNKISSASSQSIIQANVGIKLNLPLLYLVGVIGLNRAKITLNVGGIELYATENNIGAGAGVGLNFGSLFSEARLYHSRAADSTYLLGIIGIQIP